MLHCGHVQGDVCATYGERAERRAFDGGDRHAAVGHRHRLAVVQLRDPRVAQLRQHLRHAQDCVLGSVAVRAQRDPKQRMSALRVMPSDRA